MEELKIAYKSYVIVFDTFYEQWELKEDGGNIAYKNISLQKVKDYVDRLS
jgi:hypothetical protein